MPLKWDPGIPFRLMTRRRKIVVVLMFAWFAGVIGLTIYTGQLLILTFTGLSNLGLFFFLEKKQR